MYHSRPPTTAPFYFPPLGASPQQTDGNSSTHATTLARLRNKNINTMRFTTVLFASPQREKKKKSLGNLRQSWDRPEPPLASNSRPYLLFAKSDCCWHYFSFTGYSWVGEIMTGGGLKKKLINFTYSGRVLPVISHCACTAKDGRSHNSPRVELSRVLPAAGRREK